MPVWGDAGELSRVVSQSPNKFIIRRRKIDRLSDVRERSGTQKVAYDHTGGGKNTAISL